MAANKKITIVHFNNAVNVGGDVRYSVEAEKHKAEFEKMTGGIWIRRPNQPEKWVPDSNIKWFECV